MSKKISVTGWVPSDEKETTTLNECGLSDKDIRDVIKQGLYKKKKDVLADLLSEEAEGAKKVRVTVVIDVETLS